MVQMVVFINLFFIPALPVYIIGKRKEKPIQFNLDLAFQYCIAAVCNIPLTKVFIFSIRKVSGIFIPIDSGYYTLAALASALLLSAVYQAYESFKTYPDKRYFFKSIFKRFKQKITQRGIRGILKELAPACLLVFAGCFMLFVFEPILMYSTNMNDFWFDFSIMIWPVLKVFALFLLCGILIVLVIYCVDLLLSSRLIFYKGITLVGFLAFCMLYLQGNWLAGNLPVLTGDEIVWGDYGRIENLILIIALVFLSIAAVIGVWKFRLDRTIHYAAAGVSIIVIMLSVSLIATIVTNEATRSKDSFSPTTENLNTISSKQNFLIFLVDSVDSELCYEVMNNDEDFRGMLDDFTYYPDTLSAFPNTRDSIPAILTGAVNRNETNFIDFCNDAYNYPPPRSLFEKLEQNGYAINLYSPLLFWGGERNYDIRNSASIYDIKVDNKDFMAQEFKWILFKYFPYALKRYSGIETLDFNACRIIESEQGGYSWSNKEIYANIVNNEVLEETDENYFQFIHCEGTHAPYDMDKYLNAVEDGTYIQKIATSLTMIKAYLQRLKYNNAYDNSVIIIMADHGHRAAHPGYEQPEANLLQCNPILFIKGINEKHELIESDRPVSYLDLQDAFCDLIDGKQSTELFTELKQGRTRTVMWDIWGQEDHMVEYMTTGHARDVEAFIPTGNIYDLKM